MIHENSKLALKENEESGKGKTYRERIIKFMKDYGHPVTDRMVMDVLEVADVNNIRPEITRLKQKGLLEECGKTKCAKTGKTVRQVKMRGE